MRSLRSLALAVLTLGASLFAEEKPLPPDPAAHTVLIPFDETKPISGAKPERYFLDREDFDRLWSLAKENRKPEKIENTDDAHPEAILQSALYKATIGDEGLAIQASFEVITRGRWAKVRLGIADETSARRLPVHDLIVDDKPGAITDGEVAFDTAGHHVVRASFDLVHGRNWKQAALQLPSARAAMLSLTLSGDDALPAFNDAKMVAVQETINGAQTVTLGLGSSSSLKFDRVKKRPTTDALPPSGEVTTTTSLTGEMRFHGVAKTRFTFPGSARKSVAVVIDPEWTLDAAPSVASAGQAVQDMRVSMIQESGKQVLSASFPHEVSDEVTLNFHLTPKGLKVSHTPFIAPKALRWESTAQLLAQDGVKLTAKPTDAQRRLPNEDYLYKVGNATIGLPMVRYRLGNEDTLAFDSQPADAKTEASVDYVYQISEQKLEIAAAIALKRERGAWRQLRLTLPAGTEIQSIQGPSLAAWEVQGNDLFLRFGDQTGAEAKLVVYVANTVLKAAKNWTLEPLKFDSIQKIHGSAIIAAHAATEARLDGFKRDHDLREIDPGTLTNTFTITSPLEKKLGLEFERGDWKLNVALRDLATRFSADAILLTQATNVGVLVSQQIGLIVEQGALKRLVVRLPKSLPEATVTGDQLRDVQSKVKGELREYECTFQSQGGLLGRSAVTFDMQLPLTDAALAIPFVEVSDVERLRRWFVLDNSSSRETKVMQKDGVDVCAKDALPYVPEVTTQPQFYQGRTTGGLKVSFTQLQATSANEAIITLADITTVLRADGECWDTVVYSLSNRALQFLPVVLPDKAELIAVSVSGEPVRADEETRKGKRVRLIPLIQSKAGERSMEVRLVYRIKGNGVEKEVKLDDPDLVGLSAERTVWTTSLPKGWTVADPARDTFGNMEPIAEEGRDIEKLQSWMSDLGRINRAVSSSKDSSFKQEALKEAETLNKQIVDVQQKIESKSKSRSVYGDEGKNTKLSRYASKLDDDLSKVKEEQGRQGIVLKENRIANPIFSNRDSDSDRNVQQGVTLKNSWASNTYSGSVSTNGIAKVDLNERYAAYQGLVREVDKKSKANLGDEDQRELGNQVAKLKDLEKDLKAITTAAPATVGLNDNVGVNKTFFDQAAPAPADGALGLADNFSNLAFNNFGGAKSEISGENGITLNGAGTLVLSSSNTFSGGTTISGGTFAVGGGVSVTSSPADDVLLGGDQTTLVKTGAGTLNISGGTLATDNNSSMSANNLSLTSNISSNGLSSPKYDDRNAFGVTSNARSLSLSNSASNFSYTGDTVVNAGVAVNDSPQTQSSTFSGVVSGSGTIVLNGGTLKANSSQQPQTLTAGGVISGNFDLNGRASSINSSQQPQTLAGSGAVTLSSGTNLTVNNGATTQPAAGLARADEVSPLGGHNSPSAFAGRLPSGVGNGVATLDTDAKPSRGLRFEGKGQVASESIDGLLAANGGKDETAKILAEAGDKAMKATKAAPIPAPMAPSMPAIQSHDTIGAFAGVIAPASQPAPAANSMPGHGQVVGKEWGVKAAAKPAEPKPQQAFLTTQSVNQLRPTGRRSLKVDVPLAGEVWHFRKLKDHAVLALTLKPDAQDDRSTQALVFGLGLALWGLLAFVSSRFAKRRAVG